MAAPEMTKVAQAFVQHYYTMFDTNRTQLSSLYVRLRLPSALRT